MNNINEEGRFYRTSRDAFGTPFYTEDKEIGLAFKVWGVVVVILLLVGFL